MTQEYLDFEISLIPIDNETYRVHVFCDNNEAIGTMTLLLDETRLENYLLRAQNAVLVRSAQVRRNLRVAEREIQTLGRTLFEALFNSLPVRTLYDNMRRHARSNGHHLRFKLDLPTPALAALPWEYLYHPDLNDYVGLSLGSPIIRAFPAHYVQPLTLPRPLRILGMIANPVTERLINSEDERERLESALVPLAGQVQLEWVESGTIYALKEALENNTWHIFHYIGHGGFDPVEDEGFLAFEGANKIMKPAYARQLHRLFQRANSLQLAVLNSCEGARHSRNDLFSATATAFVQGGLPAVLAMQFLIPDSVAQSLTGYFYKALAKGYPPEYAISDARQSLTFDDHQALEWGVPVLYMRSLIRQRGKETITNLDNQLQPVVVSDEAETSKYSVPNKFDRFTKKARRVLAVAHEEAQAQNHGYIGTEHLLLGLVREGDGVAARVLKDLDIDLPKVRQAVELIVGRGKRTTLGKIGLTPRSKRVIEIAIEEARSMNHSYTGTEHILLGLAREGNGIAADVLESLGITLQQVHRRTIDVMDQLSK